MLERVSSMSDEFDIIHFHIDYVHYPVSRRGGWPHVTTLHGRLDLPDLQPLYDEYTDMPVVSISNDQRLPLPQADWQATVYHGLPRDLYTLCEDPDPYLVFLGRISPEKRVDRAIEIARRTGLPLRIAAKIDDADRTYFEQEIRPLFELPGVEYLGEVGDAEKSELLGRAAALLFPIDWAEPFGLVMIEAMACGTPVIAWRAGSVPEVIDDGITGYVVDTLDDAVEAVRKIPRLSRRVCRDVFEERFAVDRMARDYVGVYEGLLTGARPAAGRLPAVAAAGGRDDA
jgi:glycosyltransferase involved in cell wall biosynthesis